ncbi:MAG: hypothetical protein CVV11_13160 [Gammaproteobacteria bacterium HGW-Gammaproteobacteria-15]|nr:MAG: hypothetical protein CVV11_13160 [Gammaproteobacteria bacterium HGW-Gammaproteobacteria-15]
MLKTGVAQFAAPGIDGIDAGNDFSTGRIALSAIAGGTASKLSGGKFANGAVTGAFSRMFNDEAKHQWQRSLQAAQEEQLAVGAATKALGKVLGSSRLDLGIEIDSNGNITTSASANLDKLKISINSDMQATVLAGGPDGLVGQSFSVHDGAAQKAVASYGLIELSVASFDNGVINYDVQLGAGAYIRYSGGFDLRNWGATGQYIRAVHARESSFNNYVCKNLRGVQGC